MSDSAFDLFITVDVYPAVQRLASIDKDFFSDRGCRVMTLAMCAQESNAGNKPTHLAAYYHNLFGIKWNAETDRGRYNFVQMSPNEFETSSQKYRVYQSFEHCLINLRWHLLESSYYKDLRTSDTRKWLERVGKVWCQDNPKHVQELLAHYAYWWERVK